MKNDIPNIPSHLHISDPNLQQYELHHIVIELYHKFSLALWDQSSPTASGGQFFSTQKMHISEYACKTCLKELGILLKCRKTFEKFRAACSSSKNTGLPQFCFKKFWQLYFKNINFLKKTNSAYYADFYEFKTTRWLANVWKFPKK